MADIKWPKKRELLGYRYDKGEHATMAGAEWWDIAEPIIAEGGRADTDGDGTVAVYAKGGRRVFEVYIR